ncbi:MAG: RNA polymerase factor sigma-54 [Kiritimatiellaeota bacterium]|nr:RNA polymerase factor sigma-54 [Kiritimatiellota bacterium]
MLQQTLSQLQTLRQEQILAPQQIQSLEILLATLPELEQKITAELAENPTLELLDPGGEQLVGNPVEETEGAGGDGQADLAAQAAEKDETLATLIELGEAWQDFAPSRFAGRGRYTAEDEERRQHLFDSLVAESTLQELLLEQLRQADDVDEKTRRVAEEVIGSIDEAGYLRTHVADIAIACGVDLDAVNRALKLIQSFDPAGVGARDLRECLLLQLERKGRRKTLAYQVADRHLDEIARNRIPQVARKMGITPTRLYEVLAEIKQLSPFPGSPFSPERPDYVAPEVFVEKDDSGEWQVRTNRDCVPRLRISPRYLRMLKDPEAGSEVKAYIREKLLASRTLLRALANRESTIVRITRVLLDLQRDFFEKGPNHLQPLTMSQVAEEIGVHETTVSRAVAGKYLQTPHGLFPFRKFFTSGLDRAGGGQVSSSTVKQKLEELVRSEDPKKPLSDQKLAELLKAEGFRVARRTVAKYREELGILPSHMRRSF